ncbi:MAG: alpha/beta hydrolase [Acidimicrobiia bacterium]|nr:alpha/beta hydrolase [Acidimicrobiia bacterium]
MQDRSDARFVTSSRGVQVAVHELGGDGPLLLVCHATGFCGRAYQPLAGELASSFRVVALDLRGHGDSTEPVDGDFRWDGMADDVLAVLDALGGGPALAFGHSLGGASLLLAELARPGSLRAAYLYEPIVWPAGFRHPGDVNPMSEGARRRRETFASRAEALSRYAARPPLGLLRADALHAYVTHGFADLEDGTVRLKCRAASEAATFEAETAVTVDRFANGLASTVTLAAGGRLPPGPQRGIGPGQLVDGLAAVLGQPPIVRYAHLGHFGPLQDPVSVAADVTATLAPAG